MVIKAQVHTRQTLACPPLPRPALPFLTKMSASGGYPRKAQKQINISLGAIVISNNFSFLTLGIVLCYGAYPRPHAVSTLICVAWRYYKKFPKDPWGFKALVTACTIMCIADAVGNCGTCSTLVQCFYAWRIYLISVRKTGSCRASLPCLSLMGYSTFCFTAPGLSTYFVGIVCWMVSILATHKQVADLSLVSPTVYVWLVGSVVWFFVSDYSQYSLPQ
ncbi:hypothetical protein B0H14DRAFT_3154804 [Mycena olivaceomarginata]|nr:hypothetical protein B0H14DRAFT_3154804 [Mycena olivaceomarginata]